MSPTVPPPAPMRDGSPLPTAERRCPTCSAALLSARARYCSASCKQRAFRLRQPTRLLSTPTTLRQELQRQRALAAHTVYACPSCETRLLGRRRCPDCQLFCRALGLGGTCPDCDAVILLTELVDPTGEKGGA